MYQHWLQRHIPRYLHITRATHVQDIIDCAPLQFGEVISNQVAKKLKTCLLEDDIRSYRTSFKTIPTLISALKASNPTAYVDLQQNAETGQFQRIFICPTESNISFSSCHTFIAVDGTFIKTRFQQILLRRGGQLKTCVIVTQVMQRLGMTKLGLICIAQLQIFN